MTEPTARIPEGIGAPPEVAAQMLMAIGFVAWASARVDEVLRFLFCGLEESQYSAITAGGQNTDWLIQSCRALAKRHNAISVRQAANLFTILDSIRRHMEKRNNYIHATWHFDELSQPAYFARSRRNKYFHDAHLASVDDVINTARKLARGRFDLLTWMRAAGVKGEDYASKLVFEDFFNQPHEDDD
jgi:hypothetical protein